MCRQRVNLVEKLLLLYDDLYLIRKFNLDASDFIITQIIAIAFIIFKFFANLFPYTGLDATGEFLWTQESFNQTTENVTTLN